MSKVLPIIQVETLNGVEFVNLLNVSRFLPGDGTVELRFGRAETLVVTGESAQRVLNWVNQQADRFTDCEPVKPKAEHQSPRSQEGQQTVIKAIEPDKKPIRLFQPNASSSFTPLSDAADCVTEGTSHSTQTAAESPGSRLTSLTINRQSWGSKG